MEILLNLHPNMKWIATILVIYFAALFVAPCSDANNVCAEIKSPSKELKHSHNQDRDDNCSPFCYCACCSVSITSFKFNIPEFNIPLKEFKAKKVGIRDCFFVSNYSGNIWQPPRFNA